MIGFCSSLTRMWVEDWDRPRSQRVGWARIWRMISGGSAGRGGDGRERQKRAVRLEACVVQCLSRVGAVQADQ